MGKTIHETMDEVIKSRAKKEQEEQSKLKWDHKFLGLAKYWSGNSKDPSTKVGTVIARGKRPLSLAFNGFPQGVEDTEERLNNRELKYPLMVHGELNALSFTNEDLKDCTLYNYPFMPCSICAGPIIQRGIKRIVSIVDNNPRWANSFAISIQMFKEAEIDVILYENLIEVV